MLEFHQKRQEEEVKYMLVKVEARYSKLKQERAEVDREYR